MYLRLRGEWCDEVKEEVPLDQEACGIADVSYENGVYISCLDLFSHYPSHETDPGCKGVT